MFNSSEDSKTLVQIVWGMLSLKILRYKLEKQWSALII